MERFMQQFLRCLDTKSVIEKISSLQWREGKKSNVEAKPKHRKVVKFEKFNFLKNKNSESIVNSELMNKLDSFATAQNDYSGYYERQKSAMLTISPRPLWESEFAYGRSVTSPDSEQMEQTVAMPLLWNSVSVKQIQDREW